MGSLRRAAVLTALVVLFAGACGDGDGDDGDIETGEGSGGGKAATTTLPGISFATTKMSTPPVERGLLANVVISKADAYTRIVFEFRDALPGYAIDYTRRPIVQDGSGDEVEIEGDEVLLVRFEPASGFDLEARNGGQATYKGPKRITAGGNSDPVREVVQVSDFEAQLEWALGLNGKRPFRVQTATDPGALVLDVQGLDG